jgi:hypothetical protein
MKASSLYRIAAVLLLLFAAAHTLAFWQPDPAWKVDGLLASMRSIHFDVQGFNRTYWDFFLGAGFVVGILYLFAAVLAWHLGNLPDAVLIQSRSIRWSFALCFAAVAAVSWGYLFTVPFVFSLAITACLTAAAWRQPNPASARGL